ncbi:hypothetical protein HOF65_04215 [bacterium]|nr:hypothetical protein [bacterium]MBT3853170.1 hypothetical protein [bacterium]MBT4633728.1 hypothetical protein [bacterium]MBT6779425.1 hypothetical protein [bacterium]
MFTSKKFTHHFILDSYSISLIKSYQSSAYKSAIISTVEFTHAHAGPAILVFKFIFYSVSHVKVSLGVSSITIFQELVSISS